MKNSENCQKAVSDFKIPNIDILWKFLTLKHDNQKRNSSEGKNCKCFDIDSKKIENVLYECKKLKMF